MKRPRQNGISSDFLNSLSIPRAGISWINATTARQRMMEKASWATAEVIGFSKYWHKLISAAQWSGDSA